ncbi:unnamed protein product [Pieris brassicae]|uniref:Uncharacterized protein n=1 Tax=Pieris brassicae TaxID=7116 RepID=A0A9P0TNM0_PIEBR|nr:unnamed protein product [Pieris brassicae]
MNDSELDCLKTELEHEKNCRETASWQNGELEKQIVCIQEDLRKVDFPWDFDKDLQKESARHRQLLETIETLREQLPFLREKIRNAKGCGPDCKLKHDDLNINLDILTPAELLRTVKRFERLKTDLVSTLRSKEWRLDSESKLYDVKYWDIVISVIRESQRPTHVFAERVDDLPKQHLAPSEKRSVFPVSFVLFGKHLREVLFIAHGAHSKTSRFRNIPRKYDERVLDPKREPIKKIFCNDRLPPIVT